MQKESFRSDFGLVYYSLYLPSNPRGAIVQIAHGMIEERSKYEELATFLASFGFVVAINDHRGHGESIGGKSGKYEVLHGEMGENGFERAVQDMQALTQILKERFKGYALILIGHSMGSLLARRYLQLYEKEIDLLVLMGTPSPNVFVSLGVRLCELLEALGLHQMGAKIINALSFAGFSRAFMRRDPSNPSYTWLTRDLDKARQYTQREEYCFSFTLNSFKNLFLGLRQVFSSYPQVRNLKLPILFLSGSDDVCGGFGKGVLKAYQHLIAQGYCNVELHLFSGARHELLLEVERKTVMQEIKEWCEWNLK